MTEEQFWESNPRIISVWEKAYKAKMNATNEFIHSWVGTYGLSAVTVAVEHCLNGRKAWFSSERVHTQLSASGLYHSGRLRRNAEAGFL